MEEEGLSSGHLTAASVERAHQEHEVVQLVPGCRQPGARVSVSRISSDKLVAFDRNRHIMVTMAENVDRATRPQLADLVQLLVERVQAKAQDRGPGLHRVDVSGSAVLRACCVAMAPPDGSGAPLQQPAESGWRSTSSPDERLVWAGPGAPTNQQGRGLRRVRMSMAAVEDVATTKRLTAPADRTRPRVGWRSRNPGSVTGRVTTTSFEESPDGLCDAVRTRPPTTRPRVPRHRGSGGHGPRPPMRAGRSPEGARTQGRGHRRSRRRCPWP